MKLFRKNNREAGMPAEIATIKGLWNIFSQPIFLYNSIEYRCIRIATLCWFVSVYQEEFRMVSIRLVKSQEAELAMEIINAGKRYLKAQGVDQWQTGYPALDDIQQDIVEEKGYFLTVDGEVSGYVCIDFGGEPAYSTLEGKWATPEQYAVIHRLAFSDKARGKGLADTAFRLAEKVALQHGVTAVRVDTDNENKKMKHLLAKNGFTYRGSVWYDNSIKIAYDKIIPGKA